MRFLSLLLLLVGCYSLIMAADGDTLYRLKAQDKITVNVMRHAELTQTYTVPPDGVIEFPRAGRITVLGKTTSELSTAISTQLAMVIREPEVTVTLVEIRPQSAYVLGAVARPGPYPVIAGMRLTELLAAAGDLQGEQRDLLAANLMRGNEIIQVDLKAAIDGKDPAANMAIQEGDLLWIQPPPKITIVVSGQVKTPGAVKLNPKSTLIDALAQAGDLVDRPDRMQISLLRGAVQQPLNWKDTTTALQDGDVILVEKEPLARIYVQGHVHTPGVFDLPPGGGVLEAIALAGGVLANPALGQVAIVRKGGPTEQVNLVPALVEGKVTQNPKLEPGDLVIVPESTKRISVLGMVNRPGPYPFNDSKSLRVVDAISMAGGEVKRARLKKVMVIRVENGKPTNIPVDVIAILKEGKQEKNITLLPDDIVYVPETDNVDIGKLFSNLSSLGVLVAVL